MYCGVLHILQGDMRMRVRESGTINILFYLLYTKNDLGSIETFKRKRKHVSDAKWWPFSSQISIFRNSVELYASLRIGYIGQSQTHMY